MTDDQTFAGFTAVSSTAEDGYFFDFLGTKTRTAYFSHELQWLSGQVFGLPSRTRSIFFEYEEWQGVMAAVREAGRSFVCVELGAGWAPWLVATAFAVRSRGIEDIRLVAVEAEAANIAMIESHFRDNGLDPGRHTIIQAAIDAADASPAPDHPGGAGLMSLATVLAKLPIVDLIHCDIQFAESRAFAAGIGIVSERVRRIVVGTHSRRIEDELIELFQRSSWALEVETPCKYVVANGCANLLADGVQVWRNTRIPPPPP